MWPRSLIGPYSFSFAFCRVVGGGGLAPVEQAILVDTFPPQKRPRGVRSLQHGHRDCPRVSARRSVVGSQTTGVGVGSSYQYFPSGLYLCS